MSYLIRHFQNTDTLHLTRIWNRHHATYKRQAHISSSVFDSCVLSKPFFSAEDLFVLEVDSQPTGFLHLGFGCNTERTGLDFRHALIGCLCIEPHESEEMLADSLMAVAVKRMSAVGSKDAIAIGANTRYAFYLGMAPGDGLMGVVAGDIRLQRWLAHNEFEPQRPTACWEVDLASFRPPMDRGQFAVRRSASVVRVLDENQDDWWDAVVLGHVEQIRFQLCSRQQAAITDEILFWYTEPTWSGISSQTARVWLPEFPNEPEARDRVIFLLSEAFRQLQAERFTTVRAIASPDEVACVSVLQKFGFRSVEHGLIFQRKFA
ncbi:MAG: hypothetical protein SGI77_14200 [Pirellulaceae bacterium]|nr:hypothetical protein [Pirellulaceae bacterium]